ncbi:PfWMP4_43 [Phormidium phage Pf-WMP4]|uniref:PfWMP4_43 n=1 Tax=Phormidium phage Pf-WMP4 TaxID=2913979 RepID=Q0GBS3_9CAUD|nr:PfWMP4_43 [Phormidium phage Pf-WMP4]ABI33187.1 PfWMP4_43 [Phormidium phage Pf-WMP4]
MRSQRFTDILTSAKRHTDNGTAPRWTSLTKHPETFSPQPTARPNPPPVILGGDFDRALAKVYTLKDVLGDGDSPYHISRWQPPTLYPVDSHEDLWLLLFGPHSHPIAKVYAHPYKFYSRGVELETWRLYGKRPLKSISKFVPYLDCIPYTYNYWRGAASRRTLADLLRRDTFKVYSGADVLPAPSESKFLDFPMVGRLLQPVTRQFAQRWAKGGYVYPEGEEIVQLDVVLCHYWKQMTYVERSQHLTNREHSLLAAYYAIPALRQLKPSNTLTYHADAPIYGG